MHCDYALNTEQKAMQVFTEYYLCGYQYLKIKSSVTMSAKQQLMQKWGDHVPALTKVWGPSHPRSRFQRLWLRSLLTTLLQIYCWVWWSNIFFC